MTGSASPPQIESAPGDEELRRRPRARHWLVAALAAIVFAAALSREASFSEIVQRLRVLPPSALLAALVWLALAGVLRAVRLQMLLASRLGFGEAYAFNQIYNIVTATVPTGIGEAASAWLLRRALRVPLHHGLVSLFVGRFLDLIVLLCLFLGVVLGGGVRIAAGNGALITAAAGLLTVLIVLGLLHLASREHLAAALERWAARPQRDTRWWRALRRGLRLFAESLHILPHGSRAAVLVLLTLAMQLLSLDALHALLHGAQLDLSYGAAIVCFVVYLLLRMLPLQGIAGIGTTAAWWAIALVVLGVPSGEAAVVGAVLYVAFYAILLLLCVTCLPLLSFSRRTT